MTTNLQSSVQIKPMTAQRYDQISTNLANGGREGGRPDIQEGLLAASLVPPYTVCHVGQEPCCVGMNEFESKSDNLTRPMLCISGYTGNKGLLQGHPLIK